MCLANVRTPGGLLAAVWDGEGWASIERLSAAMGQVALPRELGDLLRMWPAAEADVRAAEGFAGERRDSAHRVSGEFGPPVRRPGKIVCVGRNYLEHAKETGHTPSSGEPILFTKHATAVIGPGDRIVRPAETRRLDYEAELGVVIGRSLKDVTPAQALAGVAGYTNLNDVSDRAAQLAETQQGQWMRGKSFDTFCPIGPELWTADVIRDPQALAIRLWVDGELRQDDVTAHMIFPVAELIAFMSRGVTLEPGDVIATGTPAGVALGMVEPRYLQPGQTVRMQVGDLPPLENTVQQG